MNHEHMAKNKKKLSKTTREVVEQYNASWSYAKENHHSRWERNWKLYNNKRVNVGYKGITNTFVPMTFSTVETITAALAAGRPSIDFVPQDMYAYIMTYYETGKKPDLKALNALFDYYWDCDNWDLKSIKTIRNGFIYGTAAEYVYWDIDKPRIINIAPRDLIIDPSLTDPMALITDPGTTYAGRRYLTTKERLAAEQVVDPETGELKPRFRKLDQVRPGKSGEQTEKELKEQTIGSISANDDEVEVIEIWTGDRIRSIANREVDIEDRENDLGIIPYVVHRFIADESIIYGKSIIDPIALEQELLNDVTNQSVDAVTDVLNPQYELDPAYADYIPKMLNAPGTVYPFRPGSLQMVQKNTAIGASAFNERQNMKNEIRETTGADQVVKGVTTDQQATATEINAQMAQAGQRFELYVRMLEREGFYQRAKIVYKMMRAYVTDMQLIPTESMDGPKFRVFNPDQYQDDYEPKIQLEASVRNQKGRSQREALQAYQILIQDPTNDLWEAKKVLYKKMFELNEEELDRIIGAQKPEMAPADPMAEDPMQDPTQQGAQPEAPVDMPVDMGAIQ